MSAGPIALLGPQRYEPIVGRVADELGMHGPVATINAGWQEREPDDAELDGLLGGRSRNLHLYGRWLDVAQRDPELAAADTRRRETMDEISAVYLVRLHRALQSLGELQARTGDPAVLEAAIDDAIGAVARLDAWHLDRLAEVHAAFAEANRPAERPVLVHHRREVASILEASAGVAIAGGHVAVLLHLLRLFDVAAVLRDRPVVAWSAGAMALTDVVVLFHDHAVHGTRAAEVFDRGLGMVPNVVVLPHAQRRLDLADRRRMSVLARRFAPASCVLLDDGTDVRLAADRGLPGEGIRLVSAEGEVVDRAA
jgi:hypothetical protein